MSFRIALSGLNAATIGLKVAANNTANAGTTGFKTSRTENASVDGSRGVRTAAFSQQHVQGNLDFTNNALDVAIGGEGFFVLSDNGSQLYSRAGAFSVDGDGNVVDTQGNRLQAYPATGNGQFDTSSLSDLRLTTGHLAGVSIDQTGVVSANFANGQSKQIGKLAIANFANPQGLQQLGGTAWAESAASGSAVLGEAETGSLGSFQSGALEVSNVDLTEQLVNMIELSRQYEAQINSLRAAKENEESLLDTLGKR